MWIYKDSSRSPAKLHFGPRARVSLLPSMSLRENLGVSHDPARFCFDSGGRRRWAFRPLWKHLVGFVPSEM